MHEKRDEENTRKKNNLGENSVTALQRPHQETFFGSGLRVGKSIQIRKKNLDRNLNHYGKHVQILAKFVITPLVVVGAIEHSWW